MTGSGFLLDTNVVSELTKSRVEPKVRDWVAAQPFGSLLISVVTLGELEKGFTTMLDLPKRARLEAWLDRQLASLFYGQVLPVTQAIAKCWGRCDGQRQLAGRPLHVPDGLIAATALEHNLTLVTRNVRDFDGLGVEILDPWHSR